MPANTADLEAAFAAAEAQATETETVGAAAIALIKGHDAAVIAAVEADNAIDQANTDRFKTILQSVTARFAKSEDELGEAIVAGTPSA